MEDATVWAHIEMMRRCTAAMIELESMKVANSEREAQGLALAYSEEDIIALTEPLYASI